MRDRKDTESAGYYDLRHSWSRPWSHEQVPNLATLVVLSMGKRSIYYDRGIDNLSSKPRMLRYLFPGTYLTSE